VSHLDTIQKKGGGRFLPGLNAGVSTPIKKMKKSLIVSVVLGLAGVCVSLWYWSMVPESMPVHWNMEGRPDRFFPKAIGLFLFPVLSALMPLLMFGLLRFDPRKENVSQSETAVGLVAGGMSCLLFVVHVLMVYISTTKGAEMPVEWVMVLVSLFVVAIGAVLPMMKSNWFVGIRTPWTLSSELVWEKTHQAGRMWMMGGGLLALSAIFLLPRQVGMMVALGAIMLGALVPVLLSYVYYRAEEKRTAGHAG
jgi:uncharacterized membrane protein